MLHTMYDPKTLQKEIENPNIRYFIINQNQGFTSIEADYNKKQKHAKIHKIYILPDHQKKGLGQKTIQYLAKWADRRNQKSLILNVNKNNTAIRFYEKMGFVLWKSEVVDIGHGFVMDDYVLKKPLSTSL